MDSQFQLGKKARIIKNAYEGLEEGIIVPKPWWFNNNKGYSYFVEVAPMVVAGCHPDELTGVDEAPTLACQSKRKEVDDNSL